MNPEPLEKYTSAITLSDMEIFVFPELMYSLVLANIMSPIIWTWRDADCFKKLEGKSPYKKLMRLRQFIIDEYEFNLDLETWGLTSKEIQLARFESFISADDIAKSNALFGYHGDKYYFDVDIRKHFGLDKYDSDIIPYWKTETVEAMDAFKLKPNYTKKAGECVSLAALYAAAIFIVCGIPLEDIYMILTPLHSQNFIDIQDGVLTNNRRLVTKTMWFNGTAISEKAQRALRNENITILAHSTGLIHCMYKDASMDKSAYQHFTDRLSAYLTASLSTPVFANFLRANSRYQRHFQFCRDFRGQTKFIKAETLFHYEHDSNFRIADDTFDKLLTEISAEDYLPYELSDRLCSEKLMTFINYENIDVHTNIGRDKLKNYLSPFVPDIDSFLVSLINFLSVEPKLPPSDKSFSASQPINIPTDSSREQVIDYLKSIRTSNTTADLAFYAYRDMSTCDWAPFITAATERNPVSLTITESKSIDEVFNWLNQMPNVSIYDGPRLAQPDEVANYKTADGLEKAITLANVIKNKTPDRQIKITADRENVTLKAKKQYKFESAKGIEKQIEI